MDQHKEEDLFLNSGPAEADLLEYRIKLYIFLIVLFNAFCSFDAKRVQNGSKNLTPPFINGSYI
jgi:hypothetical protein